MQEQSCSKDASTRSSIDELVQSFEAGSGSPWSRTLAETSADDYPDGEPSGPADLGSLLSSLKRLDQKWHVHFDKLTSVWETDAIQASEEGDTGRTNDDALNGVAAAAGVLSALESVKHEAANVATLYDQDELRELRLAFDEQVLHASKLASTERTSSDATHPANTRSNAKSRRTSRREWLHALEIKE